MDAPRIHGELLKLGIEVAERTVSRLIPKRSIPPSQTWRTFLTNHARLMSPHLPPKFRVSKPSVLRLEIRLVSRG
jgi:hypothetical protein